MLGANLSESAHNSLKSISSVRELLTLEPDFSTTSDVTVSWSNIIKNWFIIISEIMSSVNPIDSIKGNLDLDCIALSGLWGGALDSSALDESSSNDDATESAEWELTVHWVLGEPGTRDVNDCSTGGETAVWLELGDDWVSVEVELEV